MSTQCSKPLVRVAINGYGRIGRNFHRQTLEMDDVKVVAINSRAGADSHAHLLKYDSLYGKCDADIQVVGDDLEVNGEMVKVFRQKNISDIDWGMVDVDVVIEATGRFTNYADAEAHLKSGAKRVLITAPCKDDAVTTIVMGVNDADNDPKQNKIFSNASCTTNCLAPMLKVLHQEFGVESAFVNTIHAFTNTQNLLDNSNSDFRRARATTESLIPTTTGAMKAIGKVIPDLSGKIDGMAVRVPLPTVSMIDLAANLQKEVTVEELNQVFKQYADNDLKGVMGFSLEPLVSVDYRGDTHSAIIDGLSTKVLSGNHVKVVAWYDNEWGYCARVVDLVRWISCKDCF